MSHPALLHPGDTGPTPRKGPPVQLQLTILATTQLDAMRRFYRGLTGWPLVVDAPNYAELRPAPGAAGLAVYEEESFLRNLDGPAGPPAAPGTRRTTELYLGVDDLAAATARARELGGTLRGGPEPRAWGDVVQYVLDPDGNVCALAVAG